MTTLARGGPWTEVWRMSVDCGYCGRDQLWTGDLVVDEVAPEQVAAYRPCYPA